MSNNIQEFFTGAKLLFRGFRFWGARPGLMLLGALPPLIVGGVMIAGLVLLGTQAGSIAAWLTPFAEGWDSGWRSTLRLGLGIVLVLGASVVFVFLFSGLSRTVGAPFYERIAQSVDDELGIPGGRVDEAFWPSVRRAVGDALQLTLVAIPLGIAVWFLGLIPLLGSILGPALGAVVGGRALALDLTAAMAEARGIRLDRRRALHKQYRARTMGFGVACYLLFMIPFVAVLAMPAASAGGTLLGRSLVGEPTSRPPVQPGPAGTRA